MEIKQIYLQDLMFLADSLPKLPYFDHRRNVIVAFTKGEWLVVDEYVDYVYRMNMQFKAENKPRRKTFIELVAHYADITLLWLKRNAWVSVVLAEHTYFSRRNGFRGIIIGKYSVLISINGKQYPTK
jgi:hypothetical protein